MTVIEIIQGYLREYGFDGLAGDECGCLLDDIAPCGEMNVNDCEAGYKINRPPGGRRSSGTER